MTNNKRGKRPIVHRYVLMIVWFTINVSKLTTCKKYIFDTM